MMGSQITREVDSVLYTRAGPRGERRRVEDVHRAGLAPLPRRAQARAGARDAAAGRARVHRRRGLRAARARSPQFLERRPPDRRDRAALLRQAVLPLPRPPHRAAGRARGRAQAEGDLVHPDRGVLGGRDEARADRAARRATRPSSSSRRDMARLRQDRLEHPGGARPRRARDRDRDRRATRTSSTTRTT